MTLAIFYGRGRSAEEIYNSRSALPHDAIPVSLIGAGDWLQQYEPHCIRVAPLDFDGLAQFISDYDVSQVCFVGTVYRSFGWGHIHNNIDLVKHAPAITHHRKLPHSLLIIVQRFLATQGVEVVPLRFLLPSLVGKPGDSLGPPIPYPVADLLTHAKVDVNDPSRQSIFWITQSHVYRRPPDAQHFELFKREAFGTDTLIRWAGRHRRPGDKSTYVLVKVSLEDFDSLDAPAIGEDTVRLCIDNGITAAAIESNAVLVFQREKVAALCNEHSFSIAFV